MNEFFHNDFQSSAGLGRGCNPARGCSRRGVNRRRLAPKVSMTTGARADVGSRSAGSSHVSARLQGFPRGPCASPLYLHSLP